MFEQSLVVDTGQGRKGWTFAASMAGELLAVTALMLLPLLYTQALPIVQAVAVRLPAPPLPPAPAPERPASTVRPRQETPRIFTGVEAPRRIPDRVAMLIDQPAAPMPPGASPGVPGGIGEAMPPALAIPIPAPPKPVAESKAPAAPRKPLVVGGNVQEAKLLKRVIPAYPALARAARISGTVKLVGVIAADGTIQQLQVVSGHPLLVRAALEAVRQWVYRPTLLNGAPVEVIAPIDVVFTLAQ